MGWQFSENGYTIGLGIHFKATQKMIIGAEYLHDSVDVTGFDLDVDTLTVRASYKF
jgi:opacity protein-like surface antigen